MPIYLNTYHPLCKNQIGLERAHRYKIPLFVDASYRREPDFESHHPSITSVCRGRNFAPRLRKDDVVVYMTVKGDYLNTGAKHWRFTCILKVSKRLESHVEAANWYRRNHIPLPSNCMVPGNGPLPVSMTAHKSGICNAVLREDRSYQQRARDYGAFLVCTALYRQLDNPPMISPFLMNKVFRRFPVTRNPPQIEPEQLRSLIEQLGVTESVQQLDLLCPR